MGQSVIQRSFAGGELAPALHARADQAKYATGLKTCQNFIVRKEGGVDNRAGFRFVDACKTTSAIVKLARFSAAIAGQSMLLEFGAGYIRFYRNGAQVDVAGVLAYNGATAYVPGDLASSGGVNYYNHTASTGVAPPNVSNWYALTGTRYEIPSPYGTAGRLPRVSQSGNVLTLTHGDEVPRELVYTSATRWVLRALTTAATTPTPGGGSGTAGAAGTRSFRYKVTAAASETYEESNPSAVITVALAADPTSAAPIALAWTAVAGAAEYYVYGDPFNNGTYGFLGTATTNAFNDTGFVPDFNVTPPIPNAMFGAPDDYPAVSATHKQRRFFACSNNNPDYIWGSRIGFPSNFGITSPIQDDDAVTLAIAGNNNHPVRALESLASGLIALTDGGEWTITGGDGPRSPITPSSIDANQETYAGAADQEPVVVGNAILYVQARGKVLRELRFDQAVEGLAGKDLSIFASHLTRGYTLTHVVYQQNPDSVIWAVRSDGTLLGLTYIPEQDVWGWHRHTTGAGGVFEHVAVVPETDQDVLYAIVKRTIGGATVRYIERLESRAIVTFDEDAFFVDSGLSYSGTAANEISGLDHLEGQVVYGLADGLPVGPFTVTGGAITLAADASNVHLGLRIAYPDLELLDLDVQGSSVRDKRKRIQSVTILVERSARSFWAGPDADHLRQVSLSPWDTDDDEFTGQIELPLTSEFTGYGRVLIRQVDALPLTILGVLPNVEMGG